MLLVGSRAAKEYLSRDVSGSDWDVFADYKTVNNWFKHNVDKIKSMVFKPNPDRLRLM